MKISESFFNTYKEDIKSEETISGKLLVRSGMIKKVGSGIYSYHPLGYRVIKKIESIIRQEMDKAGANELLMPSLIPEKYYQESNRLHTFGKSLFRLKDRHWRDYALGPTHEELFAFSAKDMVKSYHHLPFNIYQIGRKYRDEPRPRYGLIRIREFFMKDAYSFDEDLTGLDKSYQKMYDAYCKIFDRIGLEYKIVNADTGTMGGLLSEEYQAITDIGEDELLLCNSCGFASNTDICFCPDDEIKATEKQDLTKIHTPNAATIEEVTKMMDLPSKSFVKTLIYKSDDNFYACLVRGNRDVNETKVLKLLGLVEMELASFQDVERLTNAKVGYAGPINLEIPIVVDSEVMKMTNFVVGANESEYHYRNANTSDFEVFKSADIKQITADDKCPKCHGDIIFKKGIEIGNLFKLGDKYAKATDVSFTSKDNQLIYPQMGSYGIGLERIMVSVIEQNHDEKGILWPLNIAPFQVALILIDNKDESQVQVAEELYQQLVSNRIEVIYDERTERPGVKFNDMDLIGIPIRIVVGKKAKDDLVELKSRDDSLNKEMTISDLLPFIKDYLKKEIK